MGLFAFIGVKMLNASFAATINPYGAIDYCALENNVTTIYGWASDPNAGSLALPNVTISAGGVAGKAATNRANYRDFYVHKYIDSFKPGDPKPGTYGFRAQLPNLFKGGNYTVAGVAENVGPGANTALSVNRSSGLDGDTSKATFGGTATLPAACLANRPAPAPSPAPAPAPAPTPSPVTRPVPRPIPTAPTPVNPADPGADADAAVTAGTLAVQLKIPAGNATKVHVVYSRSATALDQTSPDIDTNGTDTIHLLTGLTPRTTYYYQIIRSNNTKTVPSTTASFTTQGFNIAVLFANDKSKPVAGIKGQLGNLKASSTSDKDGLMSFKDVPAGTYKLTFRNSGRDYVQTVNAAVSDASEADAMSTSPVTLRTVINTDKLTAVSANKPVAQPDSRSVSWFIWAGLAGLLLAVMLIIVMLRRRRRPKQTPGARLAFPPQPLNNATSAAAGAGDGALLPAAGPTNTSKIFKRKAHRSDVQSSAGLAAPVEASHIGESLKTMVLRSMAEEAEARRNQSQNPVSPQSLAPRQPGGYAPPAPSNDYSAVPPRPASEPNRPPNSDT
jgi:hypothetical protein